MWLEITYGEEECTQPLLTIEKSKDLQEQTKDQVLNLFLATMRCINFPQSFQEYEHIFSFEF